MHAEAVLAGASPSTRKAGRRAIPPPRSPAPSPPGAATRAPDWASSCRCSG
jgi:hypothetical protein